MESERVFDIAIVGAGASGLALAWALASPASLAGPAGAAEAGPLSVLLIDGARDDDELRTLSFWTHQPGLLDELVRHRWRTLRLEVDGAVHDVPLRDHTYCTLFFADLQREAKARLSRHPANRIVDGRLRHLTATAEAAELTVGDEVLRARWVLDSRFHLRDLTVDEHRFHLLRQYFHGWIVAAARDVFTPDAATLLDFRAGVPRGTGFFYVLPFSASEGLVELVTLQPVDPEPLLHAYLRTAYGLAPGEVRLLDRESGVSPMTEQPFGWRPAARVRTLGVAAGRLKPSTGYALTRILQDTTDVVDSLHRHGHPFARPRTSRLHRFLDGVLLELWSRQPELIPDVFAALFRRNPADRVLRFLDERAGPAELVRLVLTLPKPPFARAAVRWLGRRTRHRVASGAARCPRFRRAP